MIVACRTHETYIFLSTRKKVLCFLLLAIRAPHPAELGKHNCKMKWSLLPVALLALIGAAPRTVDAARLPPSGASLQVSNPASCKWDGRRCIVRKRHTCKGVACVFDAWPGVRMGDGQLLALSSPSHFNPAGPCWGSVVLPQPGLPQV